MNNRLVLNLINRRHRPHQGFALVFSLGLGLVILVISAAMLIRGQEDQNKVISQKAKTASLASAEAGLARVQNLFASTKFAALYNGSQWGTIIGTDGTPVTSSGNTTNDAMATTLNTQLVAAAGGTDACGSTSSEVTNKVNTIKTQLTQLRGLATASSTTFQPLDSKNSYRLVSYQYAGEPGKIPQGQAVGRLVIEGKSTEGGSEAVSRIMVDIPISGNPGTSGGVLPGGATIPGLWVKEGGVDKGAEGSTVDIKEASSPTVPKTGRINANIVLSDCGTSSLSKSYIDSLKSIQEGIGYKAEVSNRPMPVIPMNAKTTAEGESKVYAIDSLDEKSDGGSDNKALELPLASHSPATDGYYYYTASSLKGKTLEFNYGSGTTPRKFRLYVSGDIEKTTEINGDCDTAKGCQPTNLQIFGTASTGSICMNGNASRTTRAFVLAPTYHIGSTGNGNYVGTLIGNKYADGESCASNDGKLAITQTQTWETVPDDLKPVAGSGPATTIAALSGWSQVSTDVSVESIPAPPTYAGPYLTASSSGGSSNTNTNTNNEETNNEETNNEDNEDNKCTMPNLVGTSTTGKTATTLLEAVKTALTGFTGTPTGTASTTGDNTIQTQNPAATTQVDCGTAVTFTYKLPTEAVCSMTAPSSLNPVKGSSGKITVTYKNANNSKITASVNNNATLGSPSFVTVTGDGSADFSITYDSGNNKSGTVSFSGCGTASTSFITKN